MKKIPAIILLVLMLHQMVGFYSIHQLQVYQIKKEIKKKIKDNIPKNELVKISFALSETDKINWEKDGKELISGKIMYDVVEANIDADSITFFCIADYKETQLFAQLDDYVNNFIADHTGQQKKTSQLLKKITPDYFFQIITLSTAFKINKKAINHFFLIPNYLVFQAVESPPPKYS